MLNDSNSDNVLRIGGHYGRKSHAPNVAGYLMEEQINENLMKQFLSIFIEDRERKI